MTTKIPKDYSISKLRKLGLSMEGMKYYNTVEDLIKDPPKYVVAKVVTNMKLIVDEMDMPLKKGTSMVMPVDFFFKTHRSEKDRRHQLKPHIKTFKTTFKRYYNQNLDGKKLLIIRLGGMGDHLFTQPVCKYLKEKYPTCKLIYACAPRYMSEFNSWPEDLIDSVIPIPFGRKILLQCHYHLVFQGSVERTHEGKTSSAYDMCDKVAGVTIDHTNPLYDIELTTNNDIVNKVKDSLPKKFIVIQIRATSMLRMMSSEKWISILKQLEEKLDHDFVYIDVANRSILYDKIINDFGLNKDRHYNMCFLSKDIETAVNIVSLSEGIIGIDSGFSHVGAALKKPVLTIFGPFLGETRVGYYKGIDYVEPKNCTCEKFPCFGHDDPLKICKYLKEGKPPNCLQSIDENEVVNKAIKLFEGKESI